jgi:hypothetical protein
VNQHNVHIWGTENSHVILKHERDSPKVNVFCAISEESVYDPLFFMENTITGNLCLNMLTLWLLSQLEEDCNNFIFQDGALPHFHMAVRNHLEMHLPQRWIGCARATDIMWSN